MNIRLRKLSTAFFVLKLCQLIIVYFNKGIFDDSSSILVDSNRPSLDEWIEESRFPRLLEHISKHILNKFVVWDAVYFTDLFVNPIKYEHQFVFGPLYWRFIKSINIGNNNFYKKLALSLAVNVLLHYITVLLCYILTLQVFKVYVNNKKTLHRIAYYSSICCVLSPAGIFLTAPYAESLCAFLGFLAMYLREVAINHKNFDTKSTSALKSSIFFQFAYLLSGIAVAVNYGVRANAIFLGWLYLYDFYEFAWVNRNLQDGLMALVSGGFLFISIIASNVYPYRIFCPERKVWCDYRLPSFFSYAQSHYWNVGFLQYWTPNNIPNFMFAMPLIVCTLISANYFLKVRPMKHILPYLFASLSLLFGSVFLWHVQIYNRVSSLFPICYWFVACLFSTPSSSIEKAYGSAVWKYCIVWVTVHSCLFASFLPPA